MRELFPTDWEMDRFNRLLCSDKTFAAIERGSSLEELEQIYAAELAEFQNRRQEFLIYP